MRETAGSGGGFAAVGNALCDFFYELIDYEICCICVRGPSGPQLLVRIAAPITADVLESAKETILRDKLLTVGDGESLSVTVLNPEMIDNARAETKNLSMVSARFTRAKEGGLAVFTANRALYSEDTSATLRIAAAELEPILSATLQAEALEKLKADFTAMIIHDLRAPLTAIMSAAAIVEDGLVGPVNDEQKSWMKKIAGQSRTLLDLINDFLDLSKIEAGRLDLILEDIDLATIVAASLDDYAVLLREKKIALSARLDELGCSVQADRTRLGQVFANLLSNAIKFTAEGGMIEIGAAREGEDEVRIWVKDTGVGIPANEIEGLFEKYRQAQSGRNSKQKGTGLGLAICKMIVESHSGKIWVDSREREGSTFFFTLRQAKKDAAR
jgi:signal transduction histidine kinase